MARRFTEHLLACAVLAIFAVSALPEAHAKELRITIPWFSSLTPVQRLNQEGVEAVRKHDLVKAQALFYKAYLYDPGDPFTLNNLGYSAELQGDADRAEQFYSLAEKQDCTADIDLSSLNDLKGKPMLYALQDLQNASMRLNRMNVEAIELLTRIKGIGRWSAEIYLLFAEGRPDIWPAGDLAVQAGLGKLLALDSRPDERLTRELAEVWRPHRGAVAIFTWHCYNNPAL